MQSLTHSVNIESYHVAGIVQDSGDIAMNKIDKNLCPCGICTAVGRQTLTDVNKYNVLDSRNNQDRK